MDLIDILLYAVGYTLFAFAILLWLITLVYDNTERALARKWLFR